MERNKISLLQAHKVLGLFPGLSLSKEEIQSAYRSAAKRYHPDSRAAVRTPCPASFRQCNDARDVLLRHYNIQLRRAPVHLINNSKSHVWRDKPYHPLSFMQTPRTRKFTFALKATVLSMAILDGIYQKRKQTAAAGRVACRGWDQTSCSQYTFWKPFDGGNVRTFLQLQPRNGTKFDTWIKFCLAGNCKGALSEVSQKENNLRNRIPTLVGPLTRLAGGQYEPPQHENKHWKRKKPNDKVLCVRLISVIGATCVVFAE